MNAVAVIRISIETADMITRTYLEDLTDEEMMHRPCENCNHIKWQFGHLLDSDNEMLNGCRPGLLPALPLGFKAQYSKEKSTSGNSEDFHSKTKLLELFEIQRTATFESLSKLSSTELNTPAPESISSYAPNLGAALSMIAIHWTMHSGQWAVIRRQLGRKPVI